MSKSKYTRDDRKHIVEFIENLKNDDDYVAIFEILTEDGSNSYTVNKNGVFLNLSEVSDKTLNKITKYLRKVNRKRTNSIELDIDIIPDNQENNDNGRVFKLSNYEKNILKQRKLKKILNDDSDYQEINFSTKKKKKKIDLLSV